MADYTIPYAPSERYQNPYTGTLLELMQRQAQAQAAANERLASLAGQRWQAMGQVGSTLAQAFAEAPERKRQEQLRRQQEQDAEEQRRDRLRQREDARIVQAALSLNDPEQGTAQLRALGRGDLVVPFLDAHNKATSAWDTAQKPGQERVIQAWHASNPTPDPQAVVNKYTEVFGPTGAGRAKQWLDAQGAARPEVELREVVNADGSKGVVRVDKRTGLPLEQTQVPGLGSAAPPEDVELRAVRQPDGSEVQVRVSKRTGLPIGDGAPVSGLTSAPAPRAPQAPVVVDDATSPTGRRYVAPGQAVGQPAPRPERQPTQGQYTAGGYASRMEQAERILQPLETNIAGMGLFKQLYNQGINESVLSRLQSDDYKSYAQAARNFINAVLRRESGAVISPAEFANATAQYLPVAGDSARVLEQKRANRALVISNFRREAGDAYVPPPGTEQ